MKDDSKRTYIPLPSQLHPSYHTLTNVWSFDTQWNAQLMQNFQLSGDTQDSPSTLQFHLCHLRVNFGQTLGRMMIVLAV